MNTQEAKAFVGKLKEIEKVSINIRDQKNNFLI